MDFGKCTIKVLQAKCRFGQIHNQYWVIQRVGNAYGNSKKALM